MNVFEIDPRSDPRWERLARGQGSTVFHSPQWLRVLTATYGFDVCAYVLVDGGEPVAGLPYCRIADVLGERIVSLPFTDYCDPLVVDSGEWRVLSDRLLAERRPTVIRCLANQLPLADPRFEVVREAKWHGLSLEPELDALWSGFDPSARRAIRKAEKTGVRVRATREDDALLSFFRMHLAVRKYKYKLLVQPFTFFQNIAQQMFLEDRGALILAENSGGPIAATLVLEWNDTIYIKFHANVSSELINRPSDLLIWEVIKYGKARGRKYLDFGLSDLDQPGLIRYKQKFANHEKSIRFLRHSPDGGAAQPANDFRRILADLTQVFIDPSVPDSVTARAGSLLYRFFA